MPASKLLGHTDNSFYHVSVLVLMRPRAKTTAAHEVPGLVDILKNRTGALNNTTLPICITAPHARLHLFRTRFLRGRRQRRRLSSKNTHPLCALVRRWQPHLGPNSKGGQGPGRSNRKWMHERADDERWKNEKHAVLRVFAAVTCAASVYGFLPWCIWHGQTFFFLFHSEMGR